MATTPAARLERLTRHAREGFRLTRDDLVRRHRAAAWILAHPSRKDVDDLWVDALEGRGLLARWLADDLPPEAWVHESIPLHTILASHPFPDLPQWSIPKTSNRS